jgi:hypothetical protein
MRFLLRLPLFVGLGFLLVLGLGYVASRLTGGAALDVFAVAEAVREIEEARVEESELERQLDVSRSAIETKQRVGRLWLKGRLSLTEAVRVFERLRSASPVGAEVYESHYPGRTPRERLCQEVMAWVSAELHNAAPGQLAQARARLEGEMAQLLGRVRS